MLQLLVGVPFSSGVPFLPRTLTPSCDAGSPKVLVACKVARPVDQSNSPILEGNFCSAMKRRIIHMWPNSVRHFSMS
jgi:hypothetical protein